MINKHKQLIVGIITNVAEGKSNISEERVIKAQAEMIIDLLKRVNTLEKTVEMLTNSK